MSENALAGLPAPRRLLANVPRLVCAYYTKTPDPETPEHRVVFGTSGHRGSSLERSFNEEHILAISQAICDYRAKAGIDGPLFLGADTHALSEAAFGTALEVFAANEVHVVVDAGGGYVPTPVISHAIIGHNAGRGPGGLADGVVITPSHNPPEDGGFKYNPPHGGPADAGVTGEIQGAANALLTGGMARIRRWPLRRALSAGTISRRDYVQAYVADLANAVDLAAIAAAGVRIGVDPMGGAGVAYWEPIAHRYGLSLEVTNDVVDPTFSFMTVDRDGKIRMDCSSPWAMARLVGSKDRYDIAFGNDPDGDRHGIVTRSAGLLSPNHYLAVAVDYLFRSRSGWSSTAAVGKTLVSSSLLDRVARRLSRRLLEMPVGFKWFVDGLGSGHLGFAGEESAGASFLRRDGSVWTTDKDGLLLSLLAAEMTARTGRDPGELYAGLVAELGEPVYERLDAPATGPEKRALQSLTPASVRASHLAGEPIREILTRAPGNGAPIGGLKVCAENGWFAARPSGTEDVYKIYAESFLGEAHLRRIQEEAQSLVAGAFRSAGGQ